MRGILGAFGALFLNNANAGRDSENDPAAAAGSEPKATVLLIDDDHATLDVLRPVLATEGLKVLTAQSGAKGLDMLRYCSSDVRVVVLDYNMPHLNGEQTLEFLRRLSPNVRVIGLSGVDPNLLPENYRTHVDKFLAKPFTNSALVNCVKDLAGLNVTPAPAHA
jgi:DNA-binding NtrC family response regulator